MVDVQTVSVVIAAISVVIGVTNSILTNRRAESRRQMELETRQVEFYMRHFAVSYEAVKLVHEVMYCQDWKTYDEYVEKYTTRVNLEAASQLVA